MASSARIRSALSAERIPTGPFCTAVPRRSVDQVQMEFSDELTGWLRQLAHQHGVSLFVAVLSSWALLLGRWRGQEYLVFDTRATGAWFPKIGSLLGAFECTGGLRVLLQEDATTEQLLKQVRTAAAGVSEHQDLPFVDTPAAIISSNDSPLPGLRISEVSIETARTQLELSLVDERITGTLEYVSDLFERETIERMVASWEVLLEAMLADSQHPISQLPMLTAAGREQVLYAFNDTAVAYPQDRLIHEFFEEQVRRTPDAVAVVHEQQLLTYAELNGQANRLARYLREEGIGPDQLVGLCVERSPEMVVGLLGILKAGGVYVPLDPNYPPARLVYMLKDAAPRVLLTQERLMRLLPHTDAKVIALDGGWSEIAKRGQENLDPRSLQMSSRHLAYVIYTSGSSGEPKGVAAEHRGMANRIAAQETIGAFSEDDVFCQKTSIAFVDAIFEILGPLSYGRPLVLASAAVSQDAQQLASLIERERITRLVTVPSLARSLLESAQSTRSLRSLRGWTLSGEELKVDLLRKLQERLPNCTFTNLYGSSEVAADVACYVAQGSERVGVPIGRPIANTQIHILDRHLQPVPIGMVGEIHIGGSGVARGYLNRPDLTADRFIADPFHQDPQARLYRSGDLGRWRTDGTIEYLGRSDQQVKIRGFRIELGEIEAQLARHAQVKEAAVVAREDISGEKRLVAYITGCDQGGSSIEEIRSFLKTVLPEYMVPSAFVILVSLPLTPNGKLDRRALPAPQIEAYRSREYEVPQGEVEEILAGIWQELLRVEHVGRQDNFFELGGHSLLIVQMLERLRRAGLSADVRCVLESPTLAHLAGTLAGEADGQFIVPPNRIPAKCEAITPQMLSLAELEPEQIALIVNTVLGGAGNIQDIYPLTPLQEGMLFHHLLDEQGGDTYVMSTVLSVASQERLQELIAGLQGVIDRHDALRTAVLWEQLPRPLQVVYRRATLPVCEVSFDGDRDPTEQIKEWIKPERQRLDLRQAPLMRLHVAADTHRGHWFALLQVHHIVDDDASLKILISEVVAHLERRANELPEPAPYRNHVAQALAHARAHDAEAFFRGKLAGIDEPTAPFGVLEVHGGGRRIDEARQELEAELARRVRVQSRRLSVTAATLFHAAWGLVVARTSGRDEVVFGSVLLGRLHGSAGAQRVVGMFINTLPLRLRLKGATARELVEQTQRELVELLSHEQASLAVAQRCSGMTGSAPLFSAVLNYRHGAADLDVEWRAADGVRVIASQERTNYPVTLSVDDLGEGFTLRAQTDRRIDPLRVVGYLNTAIESLVSALEQAPQAPALSLSILSESERHQVVELFNATQVVYPQEKLIHELFEEQVQRTPDAVSVVYEQQSLTYAALNSKANQLARYLRSIGVGPDQLVGVYVERSLEMVVGLLGILKAGGAYVPLDPSYPAERLQYMLTDAAPRVLLTQERLKRALLPTAAAVVALDGNWSEISQWDDGNLHPHALQLTSRHPAYVIYTSGSTGNPKGVMVEHASVVNFLSSMRLSPGIGATDCLLAVTTVSFDIAALEIYLPLASGAKLVLASREAASDARLLMAMLEEFCITVLQATPATWQLLLSGGWGGRSNLKALCGGEALSADLSEKLVSRVGALWNLYGPTETTIWSCCRQITAPSEPGSVESVGCPISNTQIRILDSQQQAAPVGVVGEICIGGAGVARGYLNLPELTAERFIEDPFSADPQARLYKTGDLGRWRPDGIIECLGRNDHQVKIRGYRIELGEIESHLARHDHVKEAVVVAREVLGEKRLVAYVTRRDQRGLSVEDLRADLKELLPDYMVPSAFVVLENLPLTPNGKLDRRALPVPQLGADASRQYEAPQGEVEEVLAGIWQSVLQVERVGRQDNFFELGGHSLMAMQVLVRLRSAFSVEMPMRSLFEFPTVRQLSDQLDGLLQASLLGDTEERRNEMEDLLERVAAMPEKEVRELVHELRMRVRP